MESERSETNSPTDQSVVGGAAALPEAIESTRVEMEALGAKISGLVLAQPPIQLLGYLLAQFHMALLTQLDLPEDEPSPKNDIIKSFQFALEHIHAVWSCHSPLSPEETPFEEGLAGELMSVLDELQNQTMTYCILSSASDTELHAKTTWALIRGNRYQVMEGEFFRFVLEPHDEALQQACGVSYVDIANGIQSLADTFRTGFSDAATSLAEHMEGARAQTEGSGEQLESVLNRLVEENPDLASEISGSINDIFRGGICNLSRHTNLPLPILEDFSYEPGENADFFKAGPFTGTPMRTLPARIKPCIKLGDEFYAVEGQFVRDSAYRAIQWGLWKRLPYRDEWLDRQAKVIEAAFPTIFSAQLRGATILNNVYYRDIHSGEWVETDLLVVFEDSLCVIEAKAGVLPMQSPAQNFESHKRVIENLIVKAFEQCKRFIEYLASEREVILYKLENGSYVENTKIRHGQFRVIFPIGLTVEAFTPFSAMAKELPAIEPILGRHPFISMSVDDLFVLRRFLPTSGQLIHYLEVRQSVSGINGVFIFDEIDHLGAYIEKNRFDMDIRDQLKEAHQVTWDGFGTKVDRYFEDESWATTPPPSQHFPESLSRILKFLDERRPSGWLSFDSLLRNYGGEGRETVTRYIDQLAPTLDQHPRRRFQLCDHEPLQCWLTRNDGGPTQEEIRRQAQVGCLLNGSAEINVLIIYYNAPGSISDIRCMKHKAPTVLQTDYPDLVREAERQRARMQKA